MRHSLAILALLSALVEAGPASCQSLDPTAAAFLTRCAGCHTLDGTRLTGPSLTHVAAWSNEVLRPAIGRMEKHVGPLGLEDLDSLSAFLRATDALVRFKREEERVRARFALELAPPNAAIGEQLFFGRKVLDKRGLACVACHAAGGRGGSLGPDLTDAFVRLGETPLRSGIENAAYPVMAPHYRQHPIARQEAAHLVAYFATLDPAAPRAPAPNHLALGGGGALIVFAGLFLYYDRRRPLRRGADQKGRG
ncbi:MAG: c-type cytochrome [Candidatus Eisenbacteria bacterium]|nr:c-type cytochrome [Candidatus Eisenbacteria bacterium]